MLEPCLLSLITLIKIIHCWKRRKSTTIIRSTMDVIPYKIFQVSDQITFPDITSQPPPSTIPQQPLINVKCLFWARTQASSL